MPDPSGLSDAVVEDLKRSLAAVRLKRGLEYYLIPARVQTQPPWLIIDRSSKIRPRFKAALKQFGKLGYAKGRVVAGRLDVSGQQLLFVVDEPLDDLQARLKGPWATRLRNHEDAEVSKLGALLKRAMLLTEDQAAKVAPGSVSYGDELSKDELTAIFGDDGPELASALDDLTTLNAKLAEMPSAGDGGEATDAVLEALETIEPTALIQLIPQFLKMAVVELPRDPDPLEEGSVLEPADVALGMAATLNTYLRARVAWEDQQDRALALLDEVERIEALAPDHEDRPLLPQLLAEYNAARVASERAQEAADRALASVQADLDAIQRGGAR